MTEHQDPPTDGRGAESLPVHLDRRDTELARRDVVSYYDADESGGPQIEEYLQILWRRKWLVAAVMATVVLLAGVQTFTTTPLYTATATIQVDPEGARVLPFREVDAGESGGYWMQDYILTQADKLKSARVARRAGESLPEETVTALSRPVRPGALSELMGWGRSLARLPFATQPAARLEAADTVEDEGTRGLYLFPTVEPVRNTRLIRVSYTSAHPGASAAVANSIVDAFIEEHLESKYDATIRASEFLDRKLVELQVSVESAEEDLLRYARQNNIVNLSERENLARKRLADLNDELTRTENELIERRARRSSLTTIGAGPIPESLQTELIRDIQNRLSQNERDIAGLQSRWGPNWPEVLELREESTDLEGQLARERARLAESTTSEYELTRARFDALTTAMATQRSLVDDLNESKIQYDILDRESESNKELYVGLLQRLKEAGVAAGLRSSNLRMANEATPPSIQSSPRRTRALSLAAIFGLMLGIGAVLLVETLDNRVQNAEDISRRLGLPVLGSVPSILPLPSKSLVRSLMRSRNGNDHTPALAFEESGREASRAQEAYRALRTSLLLSHAGSAPQIILVTSAMPGEGKTTTVANSAVALAQAGARTLMIDLDLRKPSMGDIFGINGGSGLSTYLSGASDLRSQIRETGQENLCLLPSGPVPPNPAELIGSRRMSEALGFLRESFTHIVIDTPPALEISDALVLSPAVDGVVLVARGGRTPRKAVARAAEGFYRIGAHFLGVLVNDVDLEAMSYGYYGARYYGYGRGYHDGYHSAQPTSE